MLEENNNIDDLIEKVESLREYEKYEEAINILLKNRKLNPNDYRIWYYLGASYLDNNQYKEAIESLLTATKLEPNEYGIWHNLGLAYTENKQYKEAI